MEKLYYQVTCCVIRSSVAFDEKQEDTIQFRGVSRWFNVLVSG